MNGLYRHFQQHVSNTVLASAPIDAFLEFLKPVLGTIFFPNHGLLSHKTNEYWVSQGLNQRPVLPSEPRGSSPQMVVNSLSNFCLLAFLQQDLVITLELVSVCWKLCMRHAKRRMFDKKIG